LGIIDDRADVGRAPAAADVREGRGKAASFTVQLVATEAGSLLSQYRNGLSLTEWRKRTLCYQRCGWQRQHEQETAHFVAVTFGPFNPVSSMHGQFCWYDLITTDPAAAKKYYPPLFNWKIQSFPFANPGQPYDMWAVDGKTLGGVGKLTEQQRSMGIPSHWQPSVHVNNLDETASKATQLGGRVVSAPVDIPQTGRHAVIADPEGATIAIFQSIGPFPGFDGTMQMGRPSWHELMTTDYKRAMEFYGALFGWEVIEEMDMGPLGKYLEYGMKGKMFGGMYNRTPEMGGMHPFWLPYFHVKDVETSTEAAKKAGGFVQTGPMEVPGGSWIVVMGDPQGAAFAMHSAKPTVTQAVTKAVRKATRKTIKKAKKAVRKTMKKAKAAMKTKPVKKAAKKKPAKKPASRSKARKKPAKKKSRRR
jgi:predicted enzyme related to lactoylglutathione lyase